MRASPVGLNTNTQNDRPLWAEASLGIKLYEKESPPNENCCRFQAEVLDTIPQQVNLRSQLIKEDLMIHGQEKVPISLTSERLTGDAPGE